MICIAVALAASLLQGGSLNRLATVRFRHPWLVFAGLVVQLAAQLAAPGLVPVRVAFWMLVAGTCAVGLFLVLNLKLPGLALAGVGLLMNVAVIGSNGGMPVSPEAARSVGAPISQELAGVRHEVLDRESLLPFLSDAIPVPPLGTVLSLGDVLLALGLALFVYRASAEPKGRRVATGASG